MKQKSPSKSPSGPSITLMLRLLHQHLTTRIQAALVDASYADFRVAYGNVLPFVPAEGTNVSALAARVGVTKQGMAQLVTRLVHLGYVTREPDPHDRRVHNIFLTDKGRAARPVARSVARAAEAEWMQLIGEERVETLRDTLRDLLEALDGGTAELEDEQLRSL